MFRSFYAAVLAAIVLFVGCAHTMPSTSATVFKPEYSAEDIGNIERNWEGDVVVDISPHCGAVVSLALVSTPGIYGVDPEVIVELMPVGGTQAATEHVKVFEVPTSAHSVFGEYIVVVEVDLENGACQRRVFAAHQRKRESLRHEPPNWALVSFISMEKIDADIKIWPKEKCFWSGFAGDHSLCNTKLWRISGAGWRAASCYTDTDLSWFCPDRP